jgi:hypothetical protein
VDIQKSQFLKKYLKNDFHLGLFKDALKQEKYLCNFLNEVVQLISLDFN